MTLADGAYDALVVDAEDRGEGTVAIELTIVAGTAKGEVVALVAADWTGDPLDLLGVPATLTVRDGGPPPPPPPRHPRSGPGARRSRAGRPWASGARRGCGGGARSG
jgi:hypothetical protein